MQLPTANHRSVTYPDRLVDGVVWVEYVSQATAQGHEVLVDEVESLAAAGLLAQLELGAPVVKLLNITHLVFTPDGEPIDEGSAASVLNLIGLLVSDGERYGAEAVLKGALSRASAGAQAHFADAHDSVARILRFMNAIGADAHSHALHAPWIHLAIDRPKAVGDDGGRVSVAERWPWLSSQALWWLDDLDEGALLFRVQTNEPVVIGNHSLGVQVPLPVIRGHVLTSGTTNRYAIRSTAGNRPIVGFRLSPSSEDDAVLADALLVDAIWEYIDRNGA